MHRSRQINFRASPQLAQALTATAKAEGVTVTDLIRQAVETRVAVGSGITAEQRAALDPFDKLASAARGSLEAQREIARRAVDMAFERDGEGQFVRDTETSLIEGLVFARLAAAQGDIGDQGLVISMISLLAEVIGEEACSEQLAEALARISMVADLGINDAADLLPGLVDGAPAEMVTDALGYSKRIQDKVFGHAAE